MKRFRVMIVVIMCLTIFVSMFAGCDNMQSDSVKGKALPVPKSIVTDNDRIKWESVENAVGYVVKINDEEHDCDENEYLHFQESSGKVNVQVKAKADNANARDSDWSEPIEYSYKSLNEFNGEGERISKEDEKIIKIKKLGYGVDVATAQYFNNSSCKTTPIFDEVKLSKLQLYATPYSEGESQCRTTEELSAMSSEINAKLAYDSTSSAGVKVKDKGFSASVNKNFEFSESHASNTAIKQRYTFFQHVIKGSTVSLPYAAYTAKYEVLLDPYFLKELDKVNNNKITPNSIFERFGTHILVSGVFGSKIECYSSIYSRNVVESKDINAAFGSALEASANVGKGGNKAELKQANSLSAFLKAKSGKDYSIEKESFNAKVVGGESIEMNNFSSFINNYSSWLESTNGENIYETLIGVGNDGLIPIWEYFPAKYDNLKQKFINEFESYIDKQYNEFEKNYKVKKKSFKPIENNRNEEYTVYDADRENSKHYLRGAWNDQYDKISLNDFDIEYLQQHDMYLKIYAQFEMKEIDNGYQEFWLYGQSVGKKNSVKDSKNLSICAYVDFEYQGGSLGKEYKPVTLTMFVPAKSIVKENNEYKIYLRYDANGNGEDTWKNKKMNIVVSVESLNEIDKKAYKECAPYNNNTEKSYALVTEKS